MAGGHVTVVEFLQAHRSDNEPAMAMTDIDIEVKKKAEYKVDDAGRDLNAEYRKEKVKEKLD